MNCNFPEKFVYPVFCNKTPLVYAIYDNKYAAVRYALQLIRWRRNEAKNQNFSFDFYHFHPYIHKHDTLDYIQTSKKDESWVSTTIFSACLMVRKEDPPNLPIHSLFDDGCLVQVMRFPLFSQETF
jgi:hypothetical protein